MEATAGVYNKVGRFELDRLLEAQGRQVCELKTPLKAQSYTSHFPEFYLLEPYQYLTVKIRKK